MTKKLIYYFPIGIAVTLFLMLKYFYRLAATADLHFLIAPINTVIEIVTGTTSILNTDYSYFNKTLNIIIDKSCSGANLGLIAFLMFCYLGFSLSTKTSMRFLVVPMAIFLGYVLTIIANCFRIITVLQLQEILVQQLPLNEQLVHQFIGIITNITILIITYTIVANQLTKSLSNEKPIAA